MQKVLSLLTLILIVSSFAVAQQSSSASHNVTINIPNVLMLRITDGDSNAAASSPAVNFNFVDNPTDIQRYIDAIEGSGELAPTSVSNFGNIIVFSNRSDWIVTVQASTLVTNNIFNLDRALSGVNLADITVTPSGTRGTGVSEIEDDWTLGTTAATIANGIQTQGWSALGVSGNDYRLNVDGSEDPGQYTTTVTYTISAP